MKNLVAKKSNIVVLFSTILFFVSCFKSNNFTNNNNTNNTLTFVDTILVNAGSCINFSDGNVLHEICFDSLLHESRCPLNVNCTTQGYAVIKAKCTVDGLLYASKFSTDFSLSNIKSDTIFNGLNFQLIELSPYPSNSSIIPFNQYKAKFLVSK